MLLSSGFNEVTGSNAAAAAPAAPPTAASDDSDVEPEPSEPDGTSNASPPQASHPKRKTVSITEAAYSTYLAVICWLQCGAIEFATLSSLSHPSPANRRTSLQHPPVLPLSLTLIRGSTDPKRPPPSLPSQQDRPRY
ncbi:hypothetical protein JCM11641_005342 [Rhodosporidiobolus odoratus]